MNNLADRYFLDWSGSFAAGTNMVGGKGWNLGRLQRYDFHIPVGGTLSTRAYAKFIADNGISQNIEALARSISIANLQDESILKSLEHIREKIKASPFPAEIGNDLEEALREKNLWDKAVAVRSSASMEDSSTLSFAGIHDSFLNVRGITKILEAVKECYASLWTPRAVAYRRKMAVKDEDVLLAVVILEMVEAKAAGIGFSCDPSTGRQDTVIINANFGLGESVVGGVIEPDSYYLDAAPRLARPAIKSIRLGRKGGVAVAKAEGGTDFCQDPTLAGEQALSDRQIEDLGLIILRVFQVLGHGVEHQDIEWTFDGRDFILVQARPVTALPRMTYPALKNQPEIWSNGNIKDSSPMVMSELGWNIGQGFFDKLLNAYLYAVGYPVLSGAIAMKRFNGRMYANLSLLQWSQYDCFGILPKDTNASFGGHQPEIQINNNRPFRGWPGSKRVLRTVKLVVALNKARGNAKRTFAHNAKYTEAMRKRDYAVLNDAQFIDTYAEILSACDKYLPTFAFMTVLAAYSNQKLIDQLEKHFPDRGRTLAIAVLAGSAEITSAQHGYHLLELAQTAKNDLDAQNYFATEPFKPLEWQNSLPESSPFKQAFRNFLAEFGHRGIYEYEVMNPRWRQDPSYLLEIVRNSVDAADLQRVQGLQKAKGNQAWAEIADKLGRRKLAKVRRLATGAAEGAELREMSKSVFVKFLEPLRLMFEEIGRRLQAKGVLQHQSDIYHCTCSELAAILLGTWDGTSLKYLVDERKAAKEELEKLEAPDFIVNDTPSFPEVSKAASGKTLSGLGVSAGTATGIAKLVSHPLQGTKLESGDILVAPSTDPGWTPLFLKVSGIVMETGGFLSHGAIVAREYGIPSVVNVPGAMSIIKNGQQITVDGDHGKVILK